MLLSAEEAFCLRNCSMVGIQRAGSKSRQLVVGGTARHYILGLTNPVYIHTNPPSEREGNLLFHTVYNTAPLPGVSLDISSMAIIVPLPNSVTKGRLGVRSSN